jgi:hypothetical protein
MPPPVHRRILGGHFTGDPISSNPWTGSVIHFGDGLDLDAMA